jgi:hypothetical protein
MDLLNGNLKRNHVISLRKPEPTIMNKIVAFDKETHIFCTNIEKVTDKIKCECSRTYNTDDTGISTVEKPSTILRARRQKHVGRATTGRGEKPGC